MQMQGPKIGDFIDRLVRSLQAHEISTSPEQIIDSHDVALMLMAKRRGKVDSVTLMHSLAPIFCADPAERALWITCG